MIRSVSILFLFLVPTLARSQVVYVTGSKTQLTTLDHSGWSAGLGVRQALTPWAALEAEVSLTRTDQTDPLRFTDGLFSWNERTHGAASVGIRVTPVQFEAFGVEHSPGVHFGVGVRRRDDQLTRIVFRPGAFARLGPEEEAVFVDSLVTAWGNLGDGFRAIPVRATAAEAAEPGLYVGLTEPARATDIGWAAGLSYEVRVGRVLVGARGAYRRYLDQGGKIGGANAVDLSVTTGYRF